jgi:DNA mismatch endonuclease (patch repair protein)
MSQVKGKDTGLELKVRNELQKLGLVFETNVASLPGKPDIVFWPEKIAVFLDGDFWHGYRFPAWVNTMSPFWKRKIGETRKRDQRNFRKLRWMEWMVIRIWQHEISKDLNSSIERILTALNSRQ